MIETIRNLFAKLLAYPSVRLAVEPAKIEIEEPVYRENEKLDDVKIQWLRSSNLSSELFEVLPLYACLRLSYNLSDIEPNWIIIPDETVTTVLAMEFYHKLVKLAGKYEVSLEYI